MIAAHSPLTAPTEVDLAQQQHQHHTDRHEPTAVAWSTRLVRWTELRKRSSWR